MRIDIGKRVPDTKFIRSERASLVVLIGCLVFIFLRFQFHGVTSSLPEDKHSLINEQTVPVSSHSNTSSDRMSSSESVQQREVTSEGGGGDSLQLLLKKVAKNNAVVLVGGNIGYIQLLQNFACRMRQLHTTNFIVAAFDDETLKLCQSQQIAAFRATDLDGIDSNVTKEAVPIGSPPFMSITKLKSQQVMRVLSLGFDVLLSDLDVFFFENPFAYLPIAKHLQVDVFVLSDRQFLSEPLSHFCNSGFYFVRSNSHTIEGFRMLAAMGAETHDSSEQPLFNRMLCGFNYAYRKDEKDFISESTNSFCDNTALHINTLFLNQRLFLNGDMWDWRIKDAKDPESHPIVVHVNWNFGLTIKTHRMMTNNLWVLDTQGRCAVDSLLGDSTDSAEL